jgi:hypothetical protein
MNKVDRDAKLLTEAREAPLVTNLRFDGHGYGKCSIGGVEYETTQPMLPPAQGRAIAMQANRYKNRLVTFLEQYGLQRVMATTRDDDLKALIRRMKEGPPLRHTPDR